MALKYTVSRDVEVLYEGKDKRNQFPLIFQHEGNMVVALNNVGGPSSDFIGEAMFDFFEEERGEPQRYIRLEDVHPLSDQKKLKEIGEYLYNRNIPYMIALIPVYTNPKTNEEIHLKDKPKLVNTLRHMQDHGASMIVHGYKHQYRETETGEGWEYWDVENDRPIYQEKDEKALLRSDFTNEKEFEDFIKEGKKFEENYISETLDNAIKEMNEERLVPLAFEPPHYSMSLDGYKTVANYFSTFVGTVQISKETYMKTYNPVYTSRPSFLYGMEVLPETLGYVNLQNDDFIEQILTNERYYSKFSNSQLGLFYHSYLG